MKKLMMMLGAVAMSFGLFAATPFATSFEANDAGVTDGTTWTPASPWTWGGAAYTLATGERTLPYVADEEDPMSRRDNTFVDKKTNLNWVELSTGTDELTLDIGEGNMVIDQLVKFTGFEDAPTELGNGTKIAVWMSEFLNEDETEATTNLFVTCGQVGEAVTEPIALQITGDYNLGEWYRLTIVSIGDIYDGAAGTTPRAGFKVFINGVQAATLDESYSELIFNADKMSGDAKKLYAKGALFPAIDATDATFAQVAYKGIGAIDDIIVDENGPAFRTDATVTIPVDALSEFAVATSYKVGEGEVIDLEDGQTTFDVEPGSIVTVYFDPADGKLLTKNAYTVQVDDSMTLNAEAIEEELEPKDIVATVTDAEYNEFPYATLAEALVKVQELEVGGASVEIAISKTVDAETIPNAGVLGFDEGTAIAVNPEGEVGTWLIVGNARLGADIAAEKAVTVMANEDVTELAGTLAYAGEIAGSLEAVSLTKLSGGAITIAEDGAVTVGTQITEYATFFTAPDGYKVVEAEGDDVWTYTVEKDLAEITVHLVNTPEVATVTGLVDGQKVTEGTEVKFTVELKEGFKNLKVEGAEPTATANEFAFTADKTDVTITITADEMVYAKIPEITETFTYDGTEQTAIEDGEGYEVVSGDKGTNAGNYTAEVKLADGYDAWTDKTTANKQIQWSIGQAAVTVTAVDQTIKVGEKPAEYTATVSPAPFGSDVIDYTVTCPTYVDAEGEYAIVVTPGTNPNYAVTPVDGTLTVEKAEDLPPWVPQGEKETYNTWKAGPGATESDFTGDDAEKAKKMEDSFLLNCEPTEEALKTAKDNFKITSITFEEGAWKVVTVDGKDYNGTIKLEAFENVGCTGTPVTPDDQTQLFWKASLVHPTAND